MTMTLDPLTLDPLVWVRTLRP